jgi:hypothetical protein
MQEHSWFLLLLFSYLAMWIAMNMAVLVLIGWRPLFHYPIWIWSIPGFLLIIIFSFICPYVKFYGK